MPVHRTVGKAAHVADFDQQFGGGAGIQAAELCRRRAGGLRSSASCSRSSHSGSSVPLTRCSRLLRVLPGVVIAAPCEEHGGVAPRARIAVHPPAGDRPAAAPTPLEPSPTPLEPSRARRSSPDTRKCSPATPRRGDLRPSRSASACADLSRRRCPPGRALSAIAKVPDRPRLLV